MTKGFAFLFLGLVCLLGVVGGVEQTVDISFLEALQFISITLMGLASMNLGVYLLKGE